MIRAIFLCVLLGGCAAFEEAKDFTLAPFTGIAAYDQRQLDAIAIAEHNQCASYGLTVGTPEYAQCRLQIIQIKAQNKASKRAAAAAYYGAVMSRPKPTVQPIPQSPTFTCTTYGNVTRCR